MNITELSKVLEELAEPRFRLDQVKRAFYVERTSSWDELSTWPAALRTAVAARIPWNTLTLVTTQESSSGDTVKSLFSLQDGQKIEAVLMRHDGDRNTVCVSSQVGCAMACAFCATGTMGLKRNLTADEIAEQVIHFARWLDPKKQHVTNVVYMGMGEPMHNYAEVMRSVRILNDPNGFQLGARHISISTCGIVPGILKLAEEPEQVNLAISLHSAVDATRSKIMPVNTPYPVAKLMAAVDVYAEKTNRKIFFEYLMLKGINDTKEEAEALAALLKHNIRLFHVNVIKYHDTDAFTSTGKEKRMDFVEYVRDLGIPATHRRTFGEDIDAACGQLAVNESQGLVQGKAAVKASRAKKQLAS